jgi:sigma-B regulation protein RsbU (phosphoserine phosphatase)
VAGTLLGVYDALELTDARVRLEPGDLVLFYTDGITERRRDGEQFGEARLVAVLEAFDPDGSAFELLQAVERAVAEFDPAAQDDVAMVALRVVGG